MSEWMPIESAPYATRVLAWLYLPKNPVASGPVVAEKPYCTQDEPEALGEHQVTVGCWWANGRYYRQDDTGQITHWMPLPNPPQGAK